VITSLAGDGVVLRQWTPGDFDFYASYMGTDSTARYHGGAIDRQKAWRHLASVIGHWTLRGFGIYAVESLVESRLQGMVGLWEPHGWPCREFVYGFTAEAYAAKRALGAVKIALDHVKKCFPGEAVQGFIHPQNSPALGLARTIGARLQGEVPLLEFGSHVQVSFIKGNPC
jgi:RimJ/RimL family protein N-acetyltransferase